MQVRSGEAVDEDAGLAQLQRGQNVVARTGVGGGRNRDAGRAREDLGQTTQRAIVGAEIVAPLTDAVRLVDGDQADGQFGQTLQHGPRRQPFGRNIQQVQLARPRRAPDGRTLVHGQAGIQPGGGHALLLQRLDLIGHQGDQRRDDQPHALAQDGGHLIADALAPAGRQHGQHVAPGQNLLDHRSLKPAKIGMAPHALQQGPRLVQGGREVSGRGEVQHGGRCAVFGRGCHPRTLHRLWEKGL